MGAGQAPGPDPGLSAAAGVGSMLGWGLSGGWSADLYL